MCTGNIIEFGNRIITKELIYNKRILEVGSYNVNGTLKDMVMKFVPKLYVGVDIREGPNVDIVCDICNLDLFETDAFDVTICTEVLEHVKDWYIATKNLKFSVCPGGFILITTPTIGFPYHEYPHDYWRFTLDNFKSIFVDFELIDSYVYDKIDPCVCVLFRKPINYKYVDVSILKIAEVIK